MSSGAILPSNATNPSTVESTARSTVVAPSPGLRQTQRFVQVKALTPLYQDASLQQPLSYYTAPEQTYVLVKEQGSACAIWCGGQQQAWIAAQACVSEVRDISQDITAVIPGFLALAEPGNKRNYLRVRLVQMPLDTIPFDSIDYRTLYQWLGNPARYEPDLIGYVREVSQIASTSKSMSVTEQQLFGLRSVSTGESVSINHYRLLVEDQREAVHSVTINQRTLYLPHRGDHVVLWLKPIGSENLLVQGLRRDQKNPAVGAALLPRAGEMISGGFWAREILPS